MSVEAVHQRFMENNAPYSRAEYTRAVNLSALVGWGVILTFALFSAMISGNVAMTSLYFGGYGLPISFLLTWSFGGPIFWFAMRKPIGWGRAIVWGALVAVMMVVVSIALTSAIYQSSNATHGGGEWVRVQGGVRTFYGWKITLKISALFVMLGVSVALAVRALIGGGKT